MAEDEIERQDVQAWLETRRELGPTYDDALVSSFADRIEKVVERRVSGRTDGLDRADRLVAEAGKRQLVLGVVSLGAGIPITAISAALADLPGLGIAWLGIAAVNAAHAAAVNGPRHRPNH